MIDPVSLVYGEIAAARRAWYARRADRVRRLEQPVVSVGNLTVGGVGKTPVVAHIARVLQALGERPAVLTRGYGREVATDGAVVVSDGSRICADLPRAGDEPLMLARMLDGVPIVVGADRYLSGRLAERHLGATVHVLDDGFQHVQLHRDVDLVVVDSRELSRAKPLPAGRLREPLRVARAANAVLLADGDEARARAVAERLRVARGFAVARRLMDAQRLDAFAAGWPQPVGPRVLAVAGIGTPSRFFEDLRAAGWTVASQLSFRDHQRYTAASVARIAAAMRASGAELVLTTEKDLVRLLPFRPLPFPVAWVPLSVTVEPAASFGAWLIGCLRPRADAEGAVNGQLSVVSHQPAVRELTADS